MSSRYILLLAAFLPLAGGPMPADPCQQPTIRRVDDQVCFYAADSDPRLTLKQWGLAYCIAEHVEGRAAQGGAAMGGYFQLGSHGSEDAYRNVRRFFDEWVAQRPAVPKKAGTDLSLMTCINAYESAEYGRVVREQDRFLPD